MLPISARPHAVRCLGAVAPWFLILVAQLACGSIAPKSFGNGGTSGGGAGAAGAAGSGGSEGTGGAASTGGTAGSAPTAGTAGGQGGASASGGGQGGTAGGGTAGAGDAGGSAGSTVGGGKGGGGMAGAAATGGAAGAAGGAGGGGGAPTCASLETDYQNAVNSAKSCTTSGVCPTKISKTICGCQGCPSMTFVSDPAGPNKVATDWQKLGCTCPKVLCIACLNEPTSATCTSLLTTAAAPIGGGGVIQLPRTCTDH